MLATAAEIETYAQWPETILTAAKAWAALLESLGSPRVYWITLSEVTRHLHIHLFPRWPEDNLQGIALFETRDAGPQPPWQAPVLESLSNWAQEYQVEIIN